MNINKKNSLWLSIQYIVSIVISLLTLKLNFVQFGAALFDIWLLLMSLWMVGASIDLGFGRTIVKFTAEYIDKNESEKLKLLYSTGILIFIAGGIILSFAGFFLGSTLYLNNEQLISREYYSESHSVFYLLMLQFFFRYIIIFFRSVMEGFNQYEITSKLTILNSLLNLIFVSVIFILRLSITWLALFYMLSSLLVLICYLIIFYLKFPEVRIKIGYASLKNVKELFSFSLAVQGSVVLNSLIDPVIKFIIGNLAAEGMVSYYELARRSSLALSGFYFTTFKNLLPQTSILHTVEKRQNFITSTGYKIINFSVIYSAFFFGSFSIIIVLIIQGFYKFPESVPIFYILALAETINNAGYIYYVFLTGIGKVFYLMMSQLFNLILITISVSTGYLIFGNSIGLFGYFISVFCVNLVLIRLVNKNTGLNIIDYIQNVRLFKLFFILLSMTLTANLIGVFGEYTLIISTAYSIVISIFFFKDFSKFINSLILGFRDSTLI